VAPLPVEQRAFNWSRVISRESLEDEVKSINIELGRQITTSAGFRGDARIVRGEFSVLAVLWGVIAEYDRPVRWQAESPHARDLFARAAANGQTGSNQAFQEAQQRLADLQQLVQGDGLSATQASERAADWGRIGDRPALMERLRIAEEERLAFSVASASELRSQKRLLRHEAEIVAMVAQVLTREGLPDADDADYLAFCRRLQHAALEIVEAVEREDHASVRRAASEVSKSWSVCHEQYRG
jgi:hypothetical protein